MHRHRCPTSSQQRCLDLDLPCLETQRESLAEVSQGDEAIPRNQLLPDPCPPTHKRGEKLEAPLGSRCESHNNDKIHRDLPPVQTWPGCRRNTKTADTLLSNGFPPLWERKVAKTDQAPPMCLCPTISHSILQRYDPVTRFTKGEGGPTCMPGKWCRPDWHSGPPRSEAHTLNGQAELPSSHLPRIPELDIPGAWNCVWHCLDE